MCKEKIENLTDESCANDVWTSDAKNLRCEEDDEKAKQKEIVLSADFCSCQLTRTEVSSSNCRDSKEISPKLSNLNSGRSIFFFNFIIFIVLSRLLLIFIFYIFFSYENLILL